MPINFAQLFQDSWNFVRNQRQFVIVFTIAFFLLFTGVNQLNAVLLEPLASIPDIERLSNEQLAVIMLQKLDIRTVLLLTLAVQVLFLLISCWGILTVHHISRHSDFRPVQTLIATLNRFPGVLAINILNVLLLIIGSANLLTGFAAKTAPSLFAVITVFFGCFIFIRLCLAPVSYLIGDKKLTESISFIWQKGVRRTMTLLLYCLIIYFVFRLIGQKLSELSDNTTISVITMAIISFINAFALVFTYRFYTIFTQKA